MLSVWSRRTLHDKEKMAHRNHGNHRITLVLFLSVSSVSSVWDLKKSLTEMPQMDTDIQWVG